MELQFERKRCPYLRRTVWETKEQEQTQEVRLPEGMPDIGSIIGAWGQGLMRSKEWNDDLVTAAGGVMSWVLYAPADGSAPRTLEVWLPVSLKWNLPGNGKMGSVRCHWLLKGVDGRVLSARKLMVRANVSVQAEILEPWEDELSVAAEAPQDVQLLSNSYPARLMTEAGEKAFLLDEEITFSSGEPVPERLVSVSVMPEVTEQRVSGGKAVFRGKGNFRIVYQDGEGKLHSRSYQTAFSQLADLDRDYEKDGQLSVIIVPSSMEPELTEGRLRLKCGMVAQYAASDVMLLEITADAYSTGRNVQVEVQQLQLPIELDRCEEQARFTCMLDGSGQLVDISVMSQQPGLRRLGGLCEIACNGQVQVLYYDENGTLQSRTGRWNTVWELPVADDAELLGCVSQIMEPRASVEDDRLQISGGILLEAETVAQSPLTMVTGLELGEKQMPDAARPSLILRRAGACSLWELAKSTGSTVAAIREANALESEPLDDRMLLIPVV